MRAATPAGSILPMLVSAIASRTPNAMLPSRLPRNTHDQLATMAFQLALPSRRASGTSAKLPVTSSRPSSTIMTKTDGKDQRADQRLTGGDGAGKGQGWWRRRAARRKARRGSGDRAEQAPVSSDWHRSSRRQRRQVLRNPYRSSSCHARAWPQRGKGCVIARKFDPKGSAVSEVSERSDQPRCCGNPSWTTASGHQRRLAYPSLFKLCASAAILRNIVLFNQLLDIASQHGVDLQKSCCRYKAASA